MLRSFSSTILPCVAFAAVVLSGCTASTAGDRSGSGFAQQVIIKFRAGTIACDAVSIERFAATQKISLRFVRPMSGDACVVVQSAADAAGVERAQKVLRLHPSIEWIEPDSIMKAM